jgi:hypothetical protein
MKYNRKSIFYMVLFFLVLGGINLLALYFKNNSMQFARVYYRITAGTSFQLDGEQYRIPDECFKASDSDNPSNLASFFCVYSANEIRNVNIYRLEPADIEKWRSMKGLVDVYVEDGDLIYLEAGSMQGSSVPVPFFLLPAKGISIAADEKTLGEVFVRLIQQPSK